MVNELEVNNITTKGTLITNLLAYSITHGLIDASCAAVIAANIVQGSMDLAQISFYIVLYNTLAFALQTPIGIIVDIARKPVEAAILGCLLVLVGVITYRTGSFSIIIVGLGNALFHVGGGITALNLKRGKASMPGIFVAPGAIGLLVGGFFGGAKYFTVWPLVALLIAAVIIILKVKRPFINYDYKSEKAINGFYIILSCIFASIAIRGLVGFMLTYPWKSNIFLLIAFTLAVALGKALGGILGDLFGWTRITVVGLVLAAPLLILGLNRPYLAIFGVLLFNLTMPVTLTVIANMLPGRAGFAFGLTTLALIIGAFPTFTELKPMLSVNNKGMLFGGVVLMALLVWVGLKLYFSKERVVITRNKFIQEGMGK